MDNFLYSGQATHQFAIPEVFQVYKNHKNYEIYEKKDNNQCYIYFSSNAIYNPNTVEVFQDTIISKNRFEWRRNFPQQYGKIILIRDIFKQWYLGGINHEINSIEKLYKFLYQQTLGYEIICIGSSAGGYAASLLGVLLKATRVLSFSGQYSLEYYLTNAEERPYNPFLIEHENNSEVSQYFSIIDKIRNSQVPIFYFYPGLCDIDIKQANLIQTVDNIFPFVTQSKHHSKPIFPWNLQEIINLNHQELLQLYHTYQGKKINRIEFSVRLSGYRKTIHFLSNILLKKSKYSV